MILTGWIISGLLIVFILGASVAPKLMGLQVAAEPLAVVGWPAKYMLLIGCIELACMALYAFPRTALLGAILMTGLLSAALAANLRVDNPLFSHTLFSVYFGVAMWVALWLREPRLRDLFPFS
tara:strand:+ start:8819 stop:9187 length:369 start_codon:yes stop_codon:yes gene_type:complete